MQKIQIWSNMRGSEFAIRLSTDIEDSFRAATRQEENYVKIVEETEYLHDMKYDWDYTLRYWVETHHNNKYHKNDDVIDSSSIFSERRENDNSTSLRVDLSSDYKKNSHSDRRKRASWLKLKLKCHYCGLMFSNEKERGNHEKEWHADKIRKGQ